MMAQNQTTGKPRFGGVVRLTTETHKALRIQAIHENRTAAEIAEEAVSGYLENAKGNGNGKSKRRVAA